MTVTEVETVLYLPNGLCKPCWDLDVTPDPFDGVQGNNQCFQAASGPSVLTSPSFLIAVACVLLLQNLSFPLTQKIFLVLIAFNRTRF